MITGYIFYSIIGLGISLLVYRCFLKKEKFFVFNRFFLLGSLCLCLLAPVLQIDYGFNMNSASKINVEKLFSPEDFISEVPVKTNVETFNAPFINYREIIKILYWIITGLLLARFAKNLISLFLQIKRGRSNTIHDLITVTLTKRGNPFSFFNYLFIHPEDIGDETYFKPVLIHEKAHSTQKHSADILLMEILTCFFWYNPFLWFYKKEILENHEYLADEAVVEAGGDREVYAAQLIRTSSRIMQPLFSGFSFIQTKNRLYMLNTKKPSGSRIAIKSAIALILFTAVFAVSSFSPSSNTAPFIVIVDAGHGGKDSGNNGAGPLEKEINLAIATQLQALGNEKDVKIILLRDKDEFLSLQERVDFVNSQGADLFLSLHCNASSDTQKNGVEVIFSPESSHTTMSRDYSMLLAEHLVSTVGKAEVKSANFFVLENSNIPAITLEMGYMTNPRDFALLRDKSYQKHIAGDIYKSLLSIKQESK